MSVINQTFYSSISIYVEYFLGLLISILVARSLGATAYGDYAFIIWVCSLLIVLMNGGVTTAVIKFLAEERGKQVVGNTRSIFVYFRKIQNFKAIVLITMFFALGYFYWDSLFRNISIYFLVPFLVAVYFKASYMFYISAAKGIDKFSLIAKLVTIVSPINLLVVIVLFFTGKGINEFLLLYIFISLIYFLLARRYISSLFTGEIYELPDAIKIRTVHHLKVVSANVILGFLVFKQSEIAFLNFMSTKENVAYYNIGHALAGAMVLLVPGVYSAVLLPLMSKIGVNNKGDLADVLVSSSRYLFALTIPVTLLGILYSSEIIFVMYGSDYSEAVFPLKICLINASMYSIATAAISFHMSSDRQKLMLKIMIFAAILNIILDYFLIKSFGLEGALYAALISTFSVSVLIIYTASTYLTVNLQLAVISRILLAGLLSLVIPVLLSNVMSPLLSVAVGTVFFGVFYLVITVLFKCWNLDDLKLVRYLIERITRSEINYFTKIVDYAIDKNMYLQVKSNSRDK